MAILLTCPKCKGEIEKSEDECRAPHTFVHQPCGTGLEYNPGNPVLPLVILPGQ
jgi:hypothetical protein